MGSPAIADLRGLDVLDPYAPADLGTVVEAVRRAIGAERALAYRPVRRGTGWELDLVAPTGWPDVAEAKGIFEEAFPRVFLRRFGLYDPIHPERHQRNRAVRLIDLRFGAEARSGITAPIADMLRRLGVHDSDQLRTLICEGPRLVAWIGGWREEPFTTTERDRLRALTERLRCRIGLEALLARATATRNVLEAVLEQMRAPALLLDGAGRLVHRNDAALRQMRDDPEFLTQARTAARQPGPAFDRHELVGRGFPRHVLLVKRVADLDPESRTVLWVERYGLTPRQTEVLRLLVEGCSNRDIAERLGVAQGTAELHVSAVLTRVGVPSRTRLLTMFRQPA